MARIVPFAEIVGEEVVAPRFSAEDLAAMPSVDPDGRPIPHADGVPLREILEHADGGTYRLDLPRGGTNLLWKLDDLDDVTKRHRDAGFIDVRIDHLIDRDPELNVRVGCLVDLTESERQYLHREGYV